MDTTLLASLVQLGWEEKQATIYLALLSLGVSPAGRIAEEADVNRSVTYDVLATLVERGYVREDIRNKVKRYSATDPQRIFHEARAHFENFKFMLPMFQALQYRGDKKPRIEFYEGEEAIPRIFQTSDTGSTRRFMASYAQIEKHFPHEYSRWTQRVTHAKHLTPTKHLLADDTAARDFAKRSKYHKSYEFRFLSPGTDILMDLAIVDDVLAITSFDPVSMVVIHSKELAHSAGILFDMAWKMARK